MAMALIGSNRETSLQLFAQGGSGCRMIVAATYRLLAFERLTQRLPQVWASVSDIETRLKRAETLLRVMLADPRDHRPFQTVAVDPGTKPAALLRSIRHQRHRT